MQITHSYTILGLGACQGAFSMGKYTYLYGDREVGVIRKYLPKDDTLSYAGDEYKLTVSGKDIINHPTGFAHNGSDTVFIGNSIRLNAEGTAWKAVIYCVNFKGLQKYGTLDGNIINTIEDDACIQGTRPEYVRYNGKSFVATADYGGTKNEVRLYDPEKLKTATKTSDNGVLAYRFSCPPWVQNLQWLPTKNCLLLICNNSAGKGWKFFYLDLSSSIKNQSANVLRTFSMSQETELEGFTLLPNNTTRGIATISSQTENCDNISIEW